jgi:hypothetical protein
MGFFSFYYTDGIGLGNKSNLSFRLPFQLQAFSLHKVKKQKRYQFSWKLYFIVFGRIVNLNLFEDAD